MTQVPEISAGPGLPTGPAQRHQLQLRHQRLWPWQPVAAGCGAAAANGASVAAPHGRGLRGSGGGHGAERPVAHGAAADGKNGGPGNL